MRKKEVGQAFILVLILLAVGAMLVVPALRLTGIALKSSQVILPQVRGFYVADAAQDYILWQLRQPDFANSFERDVPQTFQFDACGVLVNATIIMRAVESAGGLTLATDDRIQPTKTVFPTTIDNDATETVTYTIKLEQLSDNTSQGLDVIYDMLPDVFDENDYVPGSSYLRVEGGAWEQIDDPLEEVYSGQVRLRWPASGSFASPIRDFTVRQVKELKFQATHEFSGTAKDSVFCNWAVLIMGDTVTVSGPQASLTVGSPADPGVCDTDGLIEVGKISDPEIIPPGVETDIEYTISMFNKDGLTHHIDEVTDYLPPGFSYCGPADNCSAPSGITTYEPELTLEDVNGVERWKLYWAFSPAVSIGAGDNLTLTFVARTTKDISGSYFNEVQVLSDVTIPQIFSEIMDEENYDKFYTGYSWGTGMVTVPTYDARADGGNVTIDGNMALTVGGVSITSWQVR